VNAGALGVTASRINSKNDPRLGKETVSDLDSTKENQAERGGFAKRPRQGARALSGRYPFGRRLLDTVTELPVQG